MTTRQATLNPMPAATIATECGIVCAKHVDQAGRPAAGGSV